MTEIEVTYTFAELSEKAKDKAREAYTGEGYLDHEWWGSIYEDFSQVCTLLGINLTTRTVKLMSGKTREEPNVYFSGFSSQGDGASFEGRYYFAPTASADIREQYGDDTFHDIEHERQNPQRLSGCS